MVDRTGGWLSRSRRWAIVAAAVVAATALVPTAPASASVTISNVGTVMTVTASGDEAITFTCSGTDLAITDPVRTGSPAIACAAVTKVVVIGDGGAQTVRAAGLRSTPFTALTQVELKLGEGNDWANESPVADVVNMAGGNDTFVAFAPGPDNAVLMGTGTDTFEVRGGVGNDTLTATSDGTSASVTIATSGSPTVSRTAGSVEALTVNGWSGNDSVNASGVNTTSSITRPRVIGAEGNDTLKGSNFRPNEINGGTGTNTLTGGPFADDLWTSSKTDTVNAGNLDTVHDRPLSDLGGRTINGPTAPGAFRWDTELFGNDTTAYLRSTFYAGGTPPEPSTRVMAGGPRAGNQNLPANAASFTPTLASMRVDLAADGERDDRSVCVIDGVLTYVERGCSGDGNDLAVVFYGFSPLSTVSCVVGEDLEGGATIDCGSYGDIVLSGIKEVRAYESVDPVRTASVRAFLEFAYRFPTDDELYDMVVKATDIGTGPAFRDSLVFTDVNRGIEVDRAYNAYLRRSTDGAGRAYWIDRLRGGTRGNTLRAGLLGSDEYFTRVAGGDVTAFVTSAYRDVMGREPDALGLAYWVGRITGGGETRATVARFFLDSAESRTRFVNTEFFRFVGRAANAGEVATWIPVLLEPHGEFELDASLAGSNAFKNLIYR